MCHGSLVLGPKPQKYLQNKKKQLQYVSELKSWDLFLETHFSYEPPGWGLGTVRGFQRQERSPQISRSWGHQRERRGSVPAPNLWPWAWTGCWPSAPHLRRRNHELHQKHHCSSLETKAAQQVQGLIWNIWRFPEETVTSSGCILNCVIVPLRSLPVSYSDICIPTWIRLIHLVNILVNSLSRLYQFKDRANMFHTGPSKTHVSIFMHSLSLSPHTR